MTTREARLPGGTIEYQDAGAGPVVVLVHGAHMNASVWDRVAGDLRADHRCVVPTLPLGGHRLPVPAAADLRPPGVADLLPDARIVMVSDTYTLIPLDQPQRLAALVREFVKEER